MSRNIDRILELIDEALPPETKPAIKDPRPPGMLTNGKAVREAWQRTPKAHL